MSPATLATSVQVALIATALTLGVLAFRGRRRQEISLGIAPSTGWLNQLGIGLLLGAGAFAIIFTVMVASGATVVDQIRPQAETVVGGVVVLTVLAAYEEFLFRVLLVSGLLLTRFRRWALAISIAVTMLNHVFTDGVTALSLISAGLGGAMYTVAYLRSHRWWLPLGLHLTWNIVQGPVLGYPVSGTVIGAGPVISQHSAGPDWITGGGYGPEASVIAIAVRVLVIATVVIITRPREKPPHSAPKRLV